MAGSFFTCGRAHLNKTLPASIVAGFTAGLALWTLAVKIFGMWWADHSNLSYEALLTVETHLITPGAVVVGGLVAFFTNRLSGRGGGRRRG